ncbi:hypothetical protein COCOBI_01-2920 [Coccomyxa sp. Obi]|nr:hypothetical protein COCOBI_01-2920 [Coccomyxa sp. Obi]
MLEFAISRGLQGFAKLSGSFAVSGLLGNSVGHGRVQAFAFTDPVYVQLREVPYPIKRQSGKVIKDLREGSGIEYPVADLLKSPWETFQPEPVGWAFLRSFCIYSAIYLQGWIQRYNEAEDEARERALLSGEQEDDIDIDMPEVAWEDVKRVLMSAVRGGIRDISTTVIRRILEFKVAHRLDPRITWKLLKDFSQSTRRKLRKHNLFLTMGLTVRTTVRSGVLTQVADYIFSTTMDTYRLLVVPFLPEGVQRGLGVRQYGFPPAELQQPNGPVPALEAHAEQALPPEDVPPEEAAVFAAVEAPAEDVPQAEGNPASWSWRFNLLGKKAVGNAARCLVTLGAGAAGAGLTAGIVPVTVLALACNGVDLAFAIFVTGPDLNNWYEHNILPWRTFTLAALSAAFTVAVLVQGTKPHTKSA